MDTTDPTDPADAAWERDLRRELAHRSNLDVALARLSKSMDRAIEVFDTTPGRDLDDFYYS